MAADYEPVMKKLIKIIVRTFYDPCHVVICDILLESILLSDSEFCAKMKMLSREFNKLIIKLKEDRIIKSEIKMETTENKKQNLKNVYFFDFAEVKDIIKYKIFRMTKALEVQRNLDDDAFYCPNCERSFSALDAQACIVNFVFKCIFCKNDLIENIRKQDKDELDLKELLENLEEIIGLLKEADTFDIPTIDYFQVLELKKEKERPESINKEDKPEEKDPVSFLTDNFKVEDDSDDFISAKTDSPKEQTKQIEDQILTVNGISKKYQDITEADLDIMNEDEYSLYYEIHMKVNPE